VIDCGEHTSTILHYAPAAALAEYQRSQSASGLVAETRLGSSPLSPLSTPSLGVTTASSGAFAMHRHHHGSRGNSSIQGTRSSQSPMRPPRRTESLRLADLPQASQPRGVRGPGFRASRRVSPAPPTALPTMQAGVAAGHRVWPPMPPTELPAMDMVLSLSHPPPPLSLPHTSFLQFWFICRHQSVSCPEA